MWWKEGAFLKKYEKREEIKCAPIRKKDLADLVNLIVDNNPSDKYFNISTKIDTRSIEGSSIEAFLIHKDVPDPLSKYRIYSAKYDSNHKMENHINLMLEAGHQAYLFLDSMKHGSKADFSKLINF